MGRPRRSSSSVTPGPTTTVKQQSCFVCYALFTPFSLDNNVWETMMMKMFYNVMNIPSLGSGGDDEEDEEDEAVISLPFCPQCHSKISIMYSLHTQTQSIHSQFEAVRNEIAFTVVKTNPKNCRNGPMDLMRQQIFQRWSEKYEEKKSTGELESIMNSDAITPKKPFFELDKSFGTKSNSSYQSNLSNGDFGRSVKMKDEEDESEEDGMTSDSSYAYPNQGKQNIIARKIGARKVSATKRFIAEEQQGKRLSTKRSLSKKVEKGSPVSPLPKMPKLIPMGVIPKPENSPSVQGNKKTFKRNFLQMNQREDYIETEEMMIEPYGFNLEATDELDPLDFDHPIEQNDEAVTHQFKRPAEYVKKNKFPFKLKSSSLALRQQVGFNEQIINQDYISNDEGMFVCRLCPKNYTNQGRLKRHESLCHPTSKSVHCELCPKGFSSLLTMRRHMQNVHQQAVEGTIKCKFCPKSFLKRYSYDLHMKSHGDSRSRRFRRNNLDNGLTTIPSSLKIKSKIVKREEPTVRETNPSNCPECGQKFPLTSLLRVHMMSHKKYEDINHHNLHHDFGVKNIICQECGIFLSREELTSHREKHAVADIAEIEGEEELIEDVCPCKICGEEVLVAELTDHEMKHIDPTHKSMVELKQEKEDYEEETQVVNISPVKENNRVQIYSNLIVSGQYEDINSDDEGNVEKPICKIVEEKKDFEKMPELENENEKEVDTLDDDNLVIDEKGYGGEEIN